jgi:hypothetical protein
MKRFYDYEKVSNVTAIAACPMLSVFAPAIIVIIFLMSIIYKHITFEKIVDILTDPRY